MKNTFTIFVRLIREPWGKTLNSILIQLLKKIFFMFKVGVFFLFRRMVIKTHKKYWCVKVYCNYSNSQYYVPITYLKLKSIIQKKFYCFSCRQFLSS